jgi:hypothetical protein
LFSSKLLAWLNNPAYVCNTYHCQLTYLLHLEREREFAGPLNGYVLFSKWHAILVCSLISFSCIFKC